MNILKTGLVILLAGGVSAISFSRTTTADDVRINPGIAGGVYYAYPEGLGDNDVSFTAPPKGYKPFYVSHYGRHGSRFLINDEDYTRALEPLREAYYYDVLTPKGRLLKEQLDTLWAEAKGKGGELSPLGTRQHHAIARRLFLNNPEIFDGSPEITANSTVIMRCAHSMFAFIEALKELDPTLVIPRGSAPATMEYLNYHSPESGKFSGHKGPWYKPWRNFRQRKTNPDRLLKSLFKDEEVIDFYVDRKEFMWDLYWVTVDAQNMEAGIRLYDYWTPEELFDLWQVFNFNFYACNSSYPLAEGTLTDNAKNLLRNIVETADRYIAENKNGATLRFGHDGNIIPLTALMRLNDCYTYTAIPDSLALTYADYAICPMASNLQMIFYKNPDDPEILVKLMLNEHDIALDDLTTQTFPFYPWSNLREHLQTLIDTPSSAFLPVEYQEGDDYEEYLETELSRFN